MQPFDLTGLSAEQLAPLRAGAAAMPQGPLDLSFQNINMTPPPGQGAPQGGGDGGGESSEDIYWRNREAREAGERAAQELSERQTAVAFLTEALNMYGLGDLVVELDRIVRDSGNNAGVAMNKIRQTQPYKDRFRGLLTLQQKGVTDIANEAEYIKMESDYRRVFRDAGIQNFLGEAGSRNERDAIANLVGDFSVSVEEVRERVSDAQRVVANTSPSVREAFQRFYNVDPSMLVRYVLDPTRTTNEINRQANAAMVGGLATGQGLTFGAGVSERIGETLSGGGDLSGSMVEPQLTGIAEVQRATGRLASLERSVLSDEETALAELDLDIEAKERIKGLQSRERARFGGTSGLTSRSLARSSGV
jgi:hypothetical protein